MYVTHDQEEAFALADRLMIMREGRVAQSGTPFEIYRNPASDYVAEFIGMSNRLLVEPTASGWSIAGEQVADVAGLVRTSSDNEPITLRLRPEDVNVSMSRQALHVQKPSSRACSWMRPSWRVRWTWWCRWGTNLSSLRFHRHGVTNLRQHRSRHAGLVGLSVVRGSGLRSEGESDRVNESVERCGSGLQ